MRTLILLSAICLLSACSFTNNYYYGDAKGAPAQGEPPHAEETITPDMVSSPYKNLMELKEGQIVHLPTGRELSREEFMDLVATNRIIFVGESHDSVSDHDVQLEIITRMLEKFPGKVAVGLEMMRTNYQADADKWISGEMSEKDFMRVWMKNWGNSYEYYGQILRFLKDNKIPLVALNRPKELGGMMGEAKKPEEKKAEEPLPEIDDNDPYYNAYIAAFLSGHDEGGDEMKKRFLKGQLTWDETMAETAANFLKLPENKDKTLIILAGGNHVRYGFGIPRRLFRRLPLPYAIVEPTVTRYPEEKQGKLMDVSIPKLPLPIAEFAWIVNYKDLDGQKVLLGVRIEDSKEPKGVRVLKVSEGSSAEKAGVKDNDILTEVDGVTLSESFDLTYELSKKKIGQKGKVVVLREGKPVEIEVTYDNYTPKEDPMGGAHKK